MRFLKVLILGFLLIPLPSHSEETESAHESWLKNQILEITFFAQARTSYVALSEEAASAIRTLKVQLETEAQLLGQKVLYPDGPNSPYWQRAYSLWVQTPQSPVKYRQELRAENLLCRPGAVCTPDEYFYRHSLRGSEATDLFRAFAFREVPSMASGGSFQSSTALRGPASWVGDGQTHPTPQAPTRTPLPAPPSGHYWDTRNGLWVLCQSSSDEPCLSYGSIEDYSPPGTYAGGGEDPFADKDFIARDGGQDEILYRNPSPPPRPGSVQGPAPTGPQAHQPQAHQPQDPSRPTDRPARPSYYAPMAEAFQRCERNHQRALKVCGSSYQPVDSQAVQSELNLAAGMQLANYLQAARASTQTQGKSMYEICDTSGKMAKSMTALNAAYTAICTTAQNSCASSCEQAESYMRRMDTSDEDFRAALATTSSNFDPGRLYSACRADMNSQMTQGVFQTAQTAQMIAQANSCKQQIAASGPCATPDMWNSQACFDHCQEPSNSHHPACAQYTAMTSTCTNPRFAAQNPHCLCINHPTDPSCSGRTAPDEFADGGGGGGGSGRLPPGTGRGSSQFSSESAGSFGQNYQGGNAGQASAASQGSFPQGGGAGGPIMNSDGSSGGGGQAAGPRGAAASGYKTNIMDGVQSFGGGRRAAAAPGRRIVYGDMNSQNAFRRIAIETDDPDFDLSQYLPPEDYEPGSAPKCYYGKDRIGCMHGPSIFDMVSRQYRRIQHEMMP